MTRRDLVHKWLIYTLGLLPVWVLDACILPRFPLFGTVAPMLLPLAVVAVAVLEGSHAGAGFGLGVGLLWALAYSSGKGMMVIGLTLVGLLTGAAAQYALSQSFLGCLLCSAGALAAIDLWRIAVRLFVRSAGWTSMLRVAVPEILWSLAWTPLVYLIFHAVYRRVGGSRLA